MTDHPNNETGVAKVQGLPRARIFADASVPIRKLKSFEKKRHSIPTTSNARALEFVETLTFDELDEDLNRVYASLRKTFELKRRQLDFHGPAERCGVIETPWFNYEIRVELDESSPDTIIWQREINSIRDVTMVTGAEFAECFDSDNWVLEVSFDTVLDIEHIVDVIEDSDDESLSVDYDKNLDWCEVTTEGRAATLTATANSFLIKAQRQMTPQGLIEALLEYRERLMLPAAITSE